jgi:DNA transposition AAA+ family ATPase
MPSDMPEKPKANSPVVMTDEQVHEVREQLKAMIVSEDRRTTDIARESGIAYGTLSLWLSGKYAGRNDRIALAVQKWFETREARKQVEAVVPQGPRFVRTPTAEKVAALLQHAQHLPDICTYVGAPGIGKTSAACTYAASNSNVWKITANPSLATPRDVLQGLSRALGLYAASVPAKMMHAIVERVRGTGGLIIIDEAQHLRPEAIDQLRSIHDDADIGLALIGNEAIASRLEGDGRREKFAQLTSRVGMRKTQAKASKGDVEAILDAWGIDGATERALLAAVARKPGALRVMGKTVRLAFMLAAPTGAPVDATHIRAAFSRVSTDVLAIEPGEAA